MLLRPKRVVVNPSLHKVALVRDGILLLWSNMFSSKTTVFWRGWNANNEILFNKQPYRFLLRIVYLKADQHIVLNEYIKDALIKLGVESSKISKSSTLADDSFFRHKTLQKSMGKPLSVLFLTRVEKYKGIYEALELIKMYRENLIDFHIVGIGAELDNVKKYVLQNEMNNIIFHGYLSGEAKQKAFEKADLYLFPSYSEGMPNSLLEAMGAGLAVLSTNVGAIADFFQNNQMGFAHELPIQLERFKTSLDFFLDNPKELERMGKYNRVFAKKHFMASKVIDKLEKTFLEEIS